MLSRIEEKHWILAARQGNIDAFASLYQATFPQIYRYISCRVNDSQLAEDLTSDVFTQALRSIRRFDERGRPFVTWLYRIAKGRVADYYRKISSRPTEVNLDDIVIVIYPDLDGPLMRELAAHYLYGAITALTADQQQVIVLRFVEDQRIGCVANNMGRAPNAIKALQYRAIRSMAGRLERCGFMADEILASFS